MNPLGVTGPQADAITLHALLAAAGILLGLAPRAFASPAAAPRK
jgi:hypothetical protein